MPKLLELRATPRMPRRSFEEEYAKPGVKLV
jgi:hypothetical protein